MVSFGSHYIDENGTKSPSIHCLFKIVPKIIFFFLHTSIKRKINKLIKINSRGVQLNNIKQMVVGLNQIKR